jgi:glyoxylase-like metal-dependent hydrolase (beta-lactamase superfamily II)
MSTVVTLTLALLLALPLSAAAQDTRARLDEAARAMGADGLRSLEYNAHADGLLMVYLPKEKLLSEADVFTPPPAGTAPPMPPSPFTLNFVDNLKRLNLAVDRLLPLHGRIVPIADLHTATGHGH